MLVPRIGAGFRVTVSTLRFLDRSKGVSIQTFFVPVYHCVRLLFKNLGRHMPEDVREELTELRFASYGGNVRRSEMTHAVPSLSSFQPYAGVLRLRTALFCLWLGSSLWGVFHLTAAAK